MQPFRAPRSRTPKKGSVEQESDSEARLGKASPTRQSPRHQGKQDKEVHVVPYLKGIKMMSYRESQETAQYGEVLRWSSDSEGETAAQQDTTDSEEPTELGVVWERLVIKETQHSARDIVDMNGNGTTFTIEARDDRSALVNGNVEANSSKAASPSLSEFEAFLSQAHVRDVAKKKMTATDVYYWENLLQGDKERLANDNNARMIPVDCILVGEGSEDKNTPIVAILGPKQTHLSMLASVATLPVASPKLRTKKVPKVLWTYETVAEPTGASSKYWDANAPVERHTKTLAK